MLSVATIYATERKTSQGILLDFVRQQATGDRQRFCSWYTEDGLTPPMCALLVRHKDMAHLLVSKGASLSLTSSSKAHAAALLFGMPYELDSPPCSIASMFECIKELG
jgi:hypothetical protein